MSTRQDTDERQERWARDVLPIAGIDRPVGLDDLSDASLLRLQRRHALASIEAREYGNAYREHGEHMLALACHQKRMARFRLRMRYGAREDGTFVYEWVYSRRLFPSYPLAAIIDHGRFRLGRSHVLAWQAVAS
jgi:hypothetical protein